MKRLFAFVILATLFSAAAFAAPASADLACNDPKIDQKLVIPGAQGTVWARAWRGQPPEKHVSQMTIAKQTVSVKSNRYLAATQPARSTVIFLCGGPGLSCAQFGRPPNLPPDVNVITFDYLGLGANNQSLSNEALSIESQADVVNGLVQSYKLKNYVLYGHSFGTTVATVAASRATQNASLPKPTAVVLEGVVGEEKAFDQKLGRARAAAKTWSTLSPQDQQSFKSTYSQVARESSPEMRDKMNSDLENSLARGPRVARAVLKNFSVNPESAMSPPPAEFLAEARDPELGPEIGPNVNPSASRQYRAAGCQVFEKKPAQNSVRVFGGLVEDTSLKNPWYVNKCNCPLINRRFDPKQFPIKDVPVLYINSDTDVLTPMESAVSHYEAQAQNPNRLFISPKDGGHNEFMQGRLARCAPAIWDATLAGDLSPLQKNLARFELGQCESTGAPARANKTVQ